MTRNLVAIFLLSAIVISRLMSRALIVTYEPPVWTTEMSRSRYWVSLLYRFLLQFAFCISCFGDIKMDVFSPQVLATWRLYLFAVKVPTKVSVPPPSGEFYGFSLKRRLDLVVIHQRRNNTKKKRSRLPALERKYKSNDSADYHDMI